MVDEVNACTVCTTQLVVTNELGFYCPVCDDFKPPLNYLVSVQYEAIIDDLPVNCTRIVRANDPAAAISAVVGGANSQVKTWSVLITQLGPNKRPL